MRACMHACVFSCMRACFRVCVCVCVLACGLTGFACASTRFGYTRTSSRRKSSKSKFKTRGTRPTNCSTAGKRKGLFLLFLTNRLPSRTRRPHRRHLLTEQGVGNGIDLWVQCYQARCGGSSVRGRRPSATGSWPQQL